MIYTLTAMLAGASATADPEVNPPRSDVSIIALLAHASKHHGLRVRTHGVLNLEFEGNALFISKEARAKHLYKNSIWINLDLEAIGSSYEDLSKLNGCYVQVDGRFNADSNGHLGLFSGTLDVSTIARWGLETGDCS